MFCVIVIVVVDDIRHMYPSITGRCLATTGHVAPFIDFETKIHNAPDHSVSEFPIRTQPGVCVSVAVSRANGTLTLMTGRTAAS